jgi:hypothetical protein
MSVEKALQIRIHSQYSSPSGQSVRGRNAIMYQYEAERNNS